MRNAARIAMSSQPRAPASRGGVAGSPRKTTGSKMSMCVNLSQNICQSSKSCNENADPIVGLADLTAITDSHTHIRTQGNTQPSEF